MPVDPVMARQLKLLARRSRAGHKRAEVDDVARDAMIVQAYRAGGGVREIARLVEMSHPSILHIINRDTP